MSGSRGKGKGARAGHRGVVNGVDFEVGSGNVFEDLGLPDPELRLAKSRLAMQINELIKANEWTQARAAKELETSQPTISLLSQGKLRSITQDKLISWLVRLKQDVTITVKPAARKAHLQVELAAVA